MLSGPTKVFHVPKVELWKVQRLLNNLEIKYESDQTYADDKYEFRIVNDDWEKVRPILIGEHIGFKD